MRSLWAINYWSHLRFLPARLDVLNYFKQVTHTQKPLPKYKKYNGAGQETGACSEFPEDRVTSKHRRKREPFLFAVKIIKQTALATAFGHDSCN